MDPNTQHQMWSKWTFKVLPGRPVVPALEDVRINVARFGRQEFGSTGQMRIQYTPILGRPSGSWIIEALVEGHPVHDHDFVEAKCRRWAQYFVIGFGFGTQVDCDVRPMAGDLQNGLPREQMIIIPPLPLELKKEP